MNNSILAFQLDKINIRGRMVRLSSVLDQIIGQHDYPEWVGFSLAEALLLNAAMASAIKLNGKMSLQIQSEGALKLIATDTFIADGKTPEIRGYVRYEDSMLERDKPKLGAGVFGMIIDQDHADVPYQGMTKLDNSIARSAIHYFRDSEQIPTLIHLEVVRDAFTDQWHGGIIMMQAMAKEGGHSEVLNDLGDGFQRVETLLGSVTSEELLDQSLEPSQLIRRLFHEEDPTAHQPQEIVFGCTCSSDRVRQSLSIYSAKDLTHMINEQGKITADCQFCGAHYEMDPKTVGMEAN